MSSKEDTAEMWVKRWWDLFPYAKHGEKCQWPVSCECGLHEVVIDSIISTDPLTPEQIAWGQKVAAEYDLLKP